jgi:hypothetical protein
MTLATPQRQNIVTQTNANNLLLQQFATKFKNIQPLNQELLQQFPLKVQA